MNKKNKRIKEQVADFLIGIYQFSDNWVREIDLDLEKDGLSDLLSNKETADVRKCILSKLSTQTWIKLRCPVLESFNNRKFKNLPAILFDLKINGPTLNIKWKVADKFGNHDVETLPLVIKSLETYLKDFQQLSLFLKLNYHQECFAKDKVRV